MSAAAGEHSGARQAVLLAGAKSRLLPASVPLRFFGSAVAFHALAWLALLAGADTWPAFQGGPGWPLAALHLVTLGVLVMTAIGASLQLLPVATRQPVRWQRAPVAIWWLYTPGVAAIALGMALPATALMIGGAIPVAIALLIYALLLARNLAGARGMPAVVAHGWVALASLTIVVATALSLAGAYAGMPGLARPTALALHVAFAAYGFMGMLALGLSYILVPMFALSEAPDARQALVSCGLLAVALALAAAAAFGIAPRELRIAAIVIAAIGTASHLMLMRIALRGGMRRELGRSFRLVRIAWGFLAASLIAALAIVSGASAPGMDAPVTELSALFGLALIGGWLLTFLLGILQRIVPFLASMHASRAGSRPPTPSTLTAQRPLAIHFHCHFAALALLALAVVIGSPGLAIAAALTGFIGAVAFGAFFVNVELRLRQSRASPHPVAGSLTRIKSAAHPQ